MLRVRPRDVVCTFEADGKVQLRAVGRGAAVKAPAFAAGVLAFCSEPRSRDDVMRAMGPAAGGLFDGLADAGLLVAPDEVADTPTIFANYAGVDVHRRMLADEVRLDAYWRGLKATVRPGDVVIDGGSGSGVLATMAALCGARKVYAIERTDFADVIPQVAHDSGVGHIVEVVRGDLARVVLPEKARVIVTETFGHFAFAEGMMPDVLACAENNLLPGGVVVPNAFTLWAAPMAAAPPGLMDPFRLRGDGVDLRCLRADAANRAWDTAVDPGSIGVPQNLGTVSMPCGATWEGRLVIDAPCEALCVWFDLHMAEGVDMPTAPSAPATHWHQTLLGTPLEPGTYAIHVAPAPEDGRTIVIGIGDFEVRCR